MNNGKRAAYLSVIAGIAAGMVPENQLAHESMCFANETRFNETYFSQPLTDYSVGWKDNQDILGTLNFCAPGIQVGRRFEYKEFVNAEQFLSETVDDQRAIGSNFKTVEYTGKDTTGSTVNRGLTMRVDLDQVADLGNWRENYTNLLLLRCYRNELRRAIALLSAGATNAAKTWDTTALKDPDQDMLVELSTGQDSSGVRANRLLIGDTAWQKRWLSHRAQNTAGGFASAALTPDQIASTLQVDGVRISRERYQSSAAAKTQIVSNLVFLFYAEDNQMMQDPSHIKRFWTPTTGGTPFRVYEQQMTSKLYDITVEYYSVIKVISTVGLRKITVS